MCDFPLKVYMWGAALLEAAGIFSSYSWTFACPAHCHPSVLPVFLSGLLGGVFLGLSFALWIWWTFISHPHSASPSPPPDFQSRVRHLARLRAYVHEQS